MYTIGIGPVTMMSCNKANYTLYTIANVTNGSYYSSKNATELRSIYREIAYDILLRSSQTSQFITVPGNFSPARLYPDSHINITYIPSTDGLRQGELSVTMQSAPFGSCTPTVMLPAGVRFLSAAATSYSDEHWTDYLAIEGEGVNASNATVMMNISVFNLSDYDSNYVRLGDPYRINVPAALCGQSGEHIRLLAEQLLDIRCRRQPIC